MSIIFLSLFSQLQLLVRYIWPLVLLRNSIAWVRPFWVCWRSFVCTHLIAYPMFNKTCRLQSMDWLCRISSWLLNCEIFAISTYDFVPTFIGYLLLTLSSRASILKYVQKITLAYVAYFGHLYMYRNFFVIINYLALFWAFFSAGHFNPTRPKRTNYYA